MPPNSAWFKSSYSGNEGGDCIEVAYDGWHKSSYSGNQGGECVEIATCACADVHVRDSKLGDASPTFDVKPATWTAFATFAAAHTV
ncbi:DUF397 domain-containing protein [Streptomyces sp. NBC_00237]|uniref:DUF397 domain-containing protein n=1 Tax=Streptomyces sp. NBC_00237 TaxID=2975687 RepID=UPI00225165E0|nr:DUF397 domain-containing protein [Streptomyces sp. NBC_00237]MCX5200201.1 DUF397 domain-containing protein [Streptomyces sp. NBC_00237]